MSKLDEFIAHSMAAQARIEQKLDDFMTTQKINHEEQRAYCAAHNAWTGAIQKKLDEHEAVKNRMVGAAKVAGIVGTPLFAIIGVWLKKKFGGHP